MIKAAPMLEGGDNELSSNVDRKVPRPPPIHELLLPATSSCLLLNPPLSLFLLVTLCSR